MSKIKKIILIFLLLLISGGGMVAWYFYKYELRKDILAPKEMSKVLADIQIVEAATLTLSGNKDDKNNFFQKGCMVIYNKHGISKSKFQKNILFYLNNIDKLSEVYDSMIDELLLQKSLFYKEDNDE